MLRLYLIVTSLFSARVLAVLRAEQPLLGFVLAVICGEVVGWFLGGWSTVVLAFMASLVFIGLWKRLARSVTLGVLLGLALQLAQTWASVPTIPESNQPFFALVDAPARYPEPGRIELSLRVLDTNKAQQFVFAGRLLCEAVFLPWRNVAKLSEGSVVVVTARLRSVNRELNPFSYSSSLWRKGYQATCKIDYASVELRHEASFFFRLRESLVQRVYRDVGDSQASGLLLSMVFGVRDLLSEKLEEDFRRTGLAHLLVLSGYQVTLVFFFFTGLMKRLLLCLGNLWFYAYIPELCSVLGMLAATVLVLFAGGEDAGIRATLAALFVVFVRIFETPGGLGRGMCFALLVMAALWPGAFFNPSVQLTFAALLGILVGLGHADLPRHLITARVFIYASLYASCVASFWFDQFSLIGFVLNPVLAPLVSIVSCAVGFLGFVLLMVGRPEVAKLGVWLMQHFAEAVQSLAQLPYASIPVSGEGGLLLRLVLILLVIRTLAGYAMTWLIKRNLVRYNLYTKSTKAEFYHQDPQRTQRSTKQKV